VRELAAVQREGTSGGWTDPLIGRAVAALRIAAAGALDRPVSQRVVDAGAEAGEGRFVVRAIGRSKRTAVSASVTGEDVAQVLGRLPESAPPGRRQLLEELQATLAGFSKIQFSRPGADRGSADTLVNKALELARQVRSEHAWPREWLRRLSARAPLFLQRQA
jgi:hypothetical protein